MDGEELSGALGRMRIVTRVTPGPAHSIPIPCRFFLEGHCANGASCRFEHPEDEVSDARGSGALSGHRQLRNANTNININNNTHPHALARHQRLCAAAPGGLRRRRIHP